VKTATERLSGLASDLLGRVSVESESAVGASFDGRVADVLVLVNAGEDVVAFENLAQNVSEYEVPLRPARVPRLRRGRRLARP